MSCAAGLNVCLSLCMCDLHATDDAQGFLCHFFKTQRKLRWGQSLSAQACGYAAGLRETHTRTHWEWKHFKHETQTSWEFKRRIAVPWRTSAVVCFAIDYAGANPHQKLLPGRGRPVICSFEPNKVVLTLLNNVVALYKLLCAGTILCQSLNSIVTEKLPFIISSPADWFWVLSNPGSDCANIIWVTNTLK